MKRVRVNSLKMFICEVIRQYIIKELFKLIWQDHKLPRSVMRAIMMTKERPTKYKFKIKDHQSLSNPWLVLFKLNMLKSVAYFPHMLTTLRLEWNTVRTGIVTRSLSNSAEPTHLYGTWEQNKWKKKLRANSFRTILWLFNNRNKTKKSKIKRGCCIWNLLPVSKLSRMFTSSL